MVKILHKMHHFCLKFEKNEFEKLFWGKAPSTDSTPTLPPPYSQVGQIGRCCSRYGRDLDQHLNENRCELYTRLKLLKL